MDKTSSSGSGRSGEWDHLDSYGIPEVSVCEIIAPISEMTEPESTRVHELVQKNINIVTSKLATVEKKMGENLNKIVPNVQARLNSQKEELRTTLIDLEVKLLKAIERIRFHGRNKKVMEVTDMGGSSTPAPPLLSNLSLTGDVQDTSNTSDPNGTDTSGASVAPSSSDASQQHHFNQAVPTNAGSLENLESGRPASSEVEVGEQAGNNHDGILDNNLATQSPPSEIANPSADFSSFLNRYSPDIVLESRQDPINGESSQQGFLRNFKPDPANGESSSQGFARNFVLQPSAQETYIPLSSTRRHPRTRPPLSRRDAMTFGNNSIYRPVPVFSTEAQSTVNEHAGSASQVPQESPNSQTRTAHCDTIFEISELESEPKHGHQQEVTKNVRLHQAPSLLSPKLPSMAQSTPAPALQTDITTQEGSGISNSVSHSASVLILPQQGEKRELGTKNESSDRFYRIFYRKKEPFTSCAKPGSVSVLAPDNTKNVDSKSTQTCIEQYLEELPKQEHKKDEQLKNTVKEFQANLDSQIAANKVLEASLFHQKADNVLQEEQIQDQKAELIKHTEFIQNLKRLFHSLNMPVNISYPLQPSSLREIAHTLNAWHRRTRQLEQSLTDHTESQTGEIMGYRSSPLNAKREAELKETKWRKIHAASEQLSASKSGQITALEEQLANVERSDTERAKQIATIKTDLAAVLRKYTVYQEYTQNMVNLANRAIQDSQDKDEQIYALGARVLMMKNEAGSVTLDGSNQMGGAVGFPSKIPPMITLQTRDRSNEEPQQRRISDVCPVTGIAELQWMNPSTAAELERLPVQWANHDQLSIQTTRNSNECNYSLLNDLQRFERNVEMLNASSVVRGESSSFPEVVREAGRDAVEGSHPIGLALTPTDSSPTSAAPVSNHLTIDTEFQSRSADVGDSDSHSIENTPSPSILPLPASLSPSVDASDTEEPTLLTPTPLTIPLPESLSPSAEVSDDEEPTPPCQPRQGIAASFNASEWNSMSDWQQAAILAEAELAGAEPAAELSVSALGMTFVIPIVKSAS